MPRKKTETDKKDTKKRVPSRGNGSAAQYVVGLSPNQIRMYDLFFWAEPVDLQDPEAKELKERIDLYRKVCNENSIVPTFSDLAVALGHKRTKLIAYKNGDVKCPKEVREALQRTLIWMEGTLAQIGFNNPMYSTYVIWLQKNYFGFRDQIDVNVGAQNALPDNESAADVLKRRNFALNSMVTPEIETHDVVEADFKIVEPQETAVKATETATTEPVKKKRGRPKKSEQL